MTRSTGQRLIWSRGARPSPTPKRWRASAMLSLLALVAAAAAAALGVARIDWPWPEAVRYEVILIANVPTVEMREVVERLRLFLEARKEVSSVRLRLDSVSDAVSPCPPGRRDPPVPGGRWRLAELELEELARQPRPTAPRVALLIYPKSREVRPARWAEIADACRAAAVTVAALVPPAESLPSAWVALPTRQLPPEDGNGGTLSVILNNLDLLSPAGPLTGTTLELRSLDDAVGFNPAALAREFGDAHVPTAAASLAKIDLGKYQVADPPVLAPSDPAGRRRTWMIFPDAAADLHHGTGAGYEATLKQDGEEVARRWRVVETQPPDSLYIPLAALTAGDDTELPLAVPRSTAPGRLSRRDRLPWNLLWRKNGQPGGLTVYWPDAPHRPPPPPDRKVVRKLPDTLDQLRAYRAVILDGSAPVGLGRDTDLIPRAASASDKRYDWARARYLGGVAFGDDPDVQKRIGPVTAAEWQPFAAVLRAYYQGGGTVLALAGTPQCLDPDQGLPGAELLPLRSILQGLDTRLGPEAYERAPVGPRRLILACDDTEAAATRPFPTLPPLDDVGAALPAIADVGQQVETFFGPAAGDGERPGRGQLAEALIARLAVAGESDPEFSALLRQGMLDTVTEFALQTLAGLRGTFRHPGLHVELQGRPAFQRGTPAADDPSGRPPATKWALPFPFDQARPYVPRRDLYRTLFRRFSQPRSPFEDTPWLEPNRPLVDGLNAERFARYLGEQSSLPQPADAGPVVLALFDLAGLDRSGEVRWPLVRVPTADRRGAYVRESKPFQPIVPRAGQHFLLLGGDSSNEEASGRQRWRDQYCGGSPPPADEEWWLRHLAATRGGGDDFGRRLLFMGRGRFQRLLTAAVAEDLQRVRCTTPPTFPETVDGDEVSDQMRRFVEERLLLATLPEWVPRTNGTPWKPLVFARTGASQVPVVALAESISPSPGARPGRLILASIDANYESYLDNLRGGELARWTDFAATVKFDGTGPRSTDNGFRLRTEYTDGAAGLWFHLTVHSVNRSDLVPWLESESKPATVECSVRLHPQLGLAPGPALPLLVATTAGVPLAEAAAAAFHRSRPNAAAYRLGKAPAPSAVTVNVPVDGLGLHLPSSLFDALEGELGYAGRSAFPQVLPPLVEVRLKCNDEECSVFAPVPPAALPSQQQALFFGDSLRSAPPVVQLTDFLVESLGQPPVYRVEPADDGTSLILSPTHPGGAMPFSSSLVLRKPDGAVVASGGQLRVDTTARGQWVISPVSAAAGGGMSARRRGHNSGGLARESPSLPAGRPRAVRSPTGRS
jgi:hypothetical protein